MLHSGHAREGEGIQGNGVGRHVRQWAGQWGREACETVGRLVGEERLCDRMSGHVKPWC